MTINESTIDENGDERHPSFGNIVVTRTQGHSNLFGVDLPVSNTICLRISSGVRRERSSGASFSGDKRMMEVRLSELQWARLVSSIGLGDGTPATITFDHGPVPPVPERKSAVEERADKVRSAAGDSIAPVTEKFDEIMEMFENKAGRSAMREALTSLGHRIGNVPSNASFPVQLLDEVLDDAKAEAKAEIDAHEAAARQRLTVMAELAGGSVPEPISEVGTGIQDI